MKKIIMIVLAVAVAYTVKPEWFPFSNSKGAFDEQGNPQTLVFTHSNCGKPCGDAKKILKSRHIDFQEYKLDNNNENTALWKTFGGVNSFPNIIMGDEKEYTSGKARIVSKLALTYGDGVLEPSERYYMKKHFYDSGEPKLVMYGASWCGYCKKMREELDDNNIDYIEIDVEKSSKRKSMTKTLDISGYPLVYYGYQRFDGPRPRDIVALF